MFQPWPDRIMESTIKRLDYVLAQNCYDLSHYSPNPSRQLTDLTL